MSATYEVNLARWQDAVQNMYHLVSSSAQSVSRVACRRLTKQLILNTPPFYRSTMTGIEKELGELANDRTVGERAIKRDAYRMFLPMSRDFLEKTVAAQGNPIREQWFSVGGDKSRRVKLENAFVAFTANDARAFARERWQFGKPKPRSSSNIIGGPQFRLIPWDAFFLYLQREIAQVGHQKAGWWGGATAAKANVAPAWVRRFFGKPQIGSLKVNNLEHPTHPSVVFANSSRGIKRVQSITSRALQVAGEQLEKDLKRMVQYGPGKGGRYRLQGAD